MTTVPLKHSRYRDSVEILGLPVLPLQLPAGAASANTALSSTLRAISIYARGADIRYMIGSGSQTASATSHFLASGDSKDFLLSIGNPNIAVIRAGSTDGVLEVTGLI